MSLLDTERPATLDSRGVLYSRPGEADYLPALTGLRFWAAFHVFLFHATKHDTFVGRIIGAGPMSVALFFTLSGFILAHVYLAAGQLGGVRAFFSARFARVYPVYLLGIVLVVLLEVLPEPAGLGRGLVSGRSLIESILLVQAWDPVVACSVNCPGWSLSNEAFFYLLFPAIAALMLRLDTRAIRGVLIGAAAINLVRGLLYVVDGPTLYEPYARLFGGQPDTVFLYHPLGRLPEFVFGVALGLLALRSERLRAWSARSSTWLTVTSAALILAIYEMLPSASWQAAGPGVLLPLFGALILALAFPSPQVEPFFANRLIHPLGQWSYALYILHLPVLLFYSNLELNGWMEPGAIPLLLRIVTVIVLSALAYRFVEMPARGWLRRLLGRPAIAD